MYLCRTDSLPNKTTIEREMKKIYQTPKTDSSVAFFNPFCKIGIVGSTDATGGNLAKEREDDIEEEKAIIRLLKDTEEGNTSPLW